MSSQLNNQDLKQEISDFITPTIESLGCYLEEVTIAPVGKSRIITVIIDSDHHLNLDQVTAVTRGISDLLDTFDALGDRPFTLEVTSPGVGRPLTLPRHWRKNQGRLVKSTLSDGNVVVGRIGEASDATVLIDQIPFTYGDIKRAVVEVEFKSTKSQEEGDLE